MRLYTKGQIFISVAVGVFSAALISSLIFFKIGQKSVEKKGLSQSSDTKTETYSDESFSEQYKSDSKIEEIQSELQLQENPTVIIPVSSNTTSYTQDEIQNINVYNACNEAVVNINTKVMAYDWF